MGSTPWALDLGAYSGPIRPPFRSIPATLAGNSATPSVAGILIEVTQMGQTSVPDPPGSSDLTKSEQISYLEALWDRI
jgi:hypothetical protein